MNPILKWFFAVCLVLSLATVGGMQARKALRKGKANRLVAEAAQHYASKDYAGTLRCAQAALRANPISIEATRLLAVALENSGSPAAISWRIRASQLQPTDMTKRLDWAQTAVKLRDPKSAEDALSGLEDEAMNTARYHKISGALAWSQGKMAEAERHFQEALHLEPDNPSNLLNLGTIGLVSTNDEVAASARRTLQTIAATNETFAIEALRCLSQEAAKRKNLREALSYTERLVANPAASFIDKIDYLNLLTLTRSGAAPSWLAKVKQQATNSPADVSLLGGWLARTDGVTNALDWLVSLPQNVRINQPVPLVVCDLQIAMNDWNALLKTVENQDWGESEGLRLAFESMARRSLGQNEQAEMLWKRARRQSARHLDRLYRLVEQSEAWGLASERRDVLMEIVSEFPREKWAVELLVAQLHDAGDTEGLEELVHKLSVAEPENVRLKACLARLGFLRKSQLPTAYRLAKEAYDREPEDALVLSTYAYSLMLQGQSDEAVRVLDNLKPQALQIPWVATSYGVIEAQSGNKKAARGPLERAKSAKLLPEEIELVRHAAAN
jgi:tetratricopeptide (TPR) repeat protein